MEHALLYTTLCYLRINTKAYGDSFNINNCARENKYL